ELMFAGSTTTFKLMEWTMTELLRHPECLKKLQDETCSVSRRNSYISKDVEKMSYLNMVIKEALRTNFKYLTFGSGRRGCPGIGLALALAEVALANLVNKFNFKVGPMGNDKPDLHEGTGLDVCRKFPLMAYPFYDGPNHSKNV
ncbi:unnamed protein product, partial [Cochlearia groenlandica]